MNDSELENCRRELRSICEHTKPPPSRWQKIKARVSYCCLWNNVGDTLIGWAVWIGLIVGVPLLLSMCDSKKSPEPKSPQYTVTYDADGAQEWEKVTDDL
jgi:hypothetical protein